jgi:hypothetical protein
MKNFIGLSVLVILFSSCGLFFIDGGNDNNISTLALTSGGYLSTDDYNEKCPFLFRDSTGTNYLFFSSDRQGSYDIYFSVMNPDGTFQDPIRLPSPVNGTNSDELFPILRPGTMASYIIAFLRISNNQTNLIPYQVDNLALANPQTGVPTSVSGNFTGLGLYKEGFNIYLLLSHGNDSQIEYYIFNQLDYYLSTNIILSKPVHSINGISIKHTNMDYIDLFIEEVSINGKKQLSAEGIFYHNIVGMGFQKVPLAISTPDYGSKFNDITPFIDQVGGFKVYFASDRYGNGNYDLYRYNVYTFNKLPEVVPLYSWSPAPGIVINVPTQNYTNYLDSISVNADKAMATKIQLMEMYCALDNNPFVKMIPGTGWAYSYLAVPAGTHSIKVYGIDVFYRFSATNTVQTVITN